MEFSVSIPVKISNGCGFLDFPSAMKRIPLKAEIGCLSLFLKSEEASLASPLFIVCSGSSYLTRDKCRSKNVLDMFTYNPRKPLIRFNRGKSFPITSPQECLRIEIVDLEQSRIDLSGVVVIEIGGLVSDKYLVL